MRQAGVRFNEASLNSGDSSLVGSGMLAFTPPGVGVVVYP